MVSPTFTTDRNQTSYEKTSVTPVHPMIQPNSIQLKLAYSTTAQTPSAPLLDNPSSAGSVSSVRDSTKRSPLAELVNLLKIDYQKSKTGKARVLTSKNVSKLLQEGRKEMAIGDEEKNIKNWKENRKEITMRRNYNIKKK